MNRMRHDSYSAEIEYDENDRLFRGRVLDLRGPVTFEGRSVKELERAFRSAVDTYNEEGDGQADRPLSGKFVVRINPELHRSISVAADHMGRSINSWVTEALEKAVKGDSPFTYYMKLVNRADDSSGERIAALARRLIALGMTGGRQSATGDIVTFTPNFRHLVPTEILESAAEDLKFEVISVTGPNYF